jgi:hypothetical protein
MPPATPRPPAWRLNAHLQGNDPAPFPKPIAPDSLGLTWSAPLEQGAEPDGTVRRGGAPPGRGMDAGLVPALNRLVDPVTRGEARSADGAPV